MAVVAVPFILYLVRFCSPKPCKEYLKIAAGGSPAVGAAVPPARALGTVVVVVVVTTS